MKSYKHFSEKERGKLYAMVKSKLSVAKMAKFLNRDRSSIYRELKRNNLENGYLPGSAHLKAQSRRKQNRQKITPGSPLYNYILSKLKKGWSPEQIAGRLRVSKKPYYVCHETIYQYIYKNGPENKWYQYLLRSKLHRGKRRGRKLSSRKYINIRLIDERPKDIEKRSNIGHWEGDTIAFAGSSYINVTTLVERKTRYVVLKRNENRKSEHVMQSIAKEIKSFPKKHWKTLTLDQGSEFGYFHLLENNTHCQPYYCHARSPWERGTNENTNGRLRRYLPRSFNLNNLTQEMLKNLEKNMNNIPRKCLGFITPSEAMRQA